MVQLNSLHSNTKFTVVEEDYNKLRFVDAMVINNNSSIEYYTTEEKLSLVH